MANEMSASGAFMKADYVRLVAMSAIELIELHRETELKKFEQKLRNWSSERRPNRFTTPTRVYLAMRGAYESRNSGLGKRIALPASTITTYVYGKRSELTSDEWKMIHFALPETSDEWFPDDQPALIKRYGKHCIEVAERLIRLTHSQLIDGSVFVSSDDWDMIASS